MWMCWSFLGMHSCRRLKRYLSYGYRYIWYVIKCVKKKTLMNLRPWIWICQSDESHVQGLWLGTAPWTTWKGNCWHPKQTRQALFSLVAVREHIQWKLSLSCASGSETPSYNKNITTTQSTIIDSAPATFRLSAVYKKNIERQVKSTHQSVPLNLPSAKNQSKSLGSADSVSSSASNSSEPGSEYKNFHLLLVSGDKLRSKRLA